ncbi:hypothetical protein FPE89_01415 [Salmonella enterica subsp. diarizonae]|nr:hypothetical protein [Salmonella enterica subsp. diarizonae]
MTDDKNILNFPEGRKRKPSSKNKKPEDILLELSKKLIEDGDNPPPRKPPEPLEALPPGTVIHVDGAGHAIGSGNVVNHGTINIGTKLPRPKTIVKTGDGVLDAAQKAKLHELIREWSNTHNAIKKSSLSYQEAWARLNAKMKTPSYHEIKKEQFENALKYLRTQIGVLRRMASAPKKVVDWRTKTIAAVQARCSERGWQTWRKEFMMKNYGKSSLRQFTDSELEKFYRTVMNKK